MAIYLVGDIQGCYQELRALLQQVAFDPAKDELWPAGDIVARGPDSLATIRYLKSLGNSCKMVLGNHDLHLLATYYGIKKVKKQDLLDDLLAAEDIDELMDWLIQQPLLRQINNENAYVSHAGISPQWSVKQAIKSARFAEKKLSSKNKLKWLNRMYGNEPNNWLQVDSKTDRFRFAINSFTRMRYCLLDGSLEFQCKLPVKQSPKNIKPWFQLSDAIKTNTWVFGHWAALMGETPKASLYALDTGCVWGGHLTLLRWHDKALFSQAKIC